ncbi:hypothetical protein QYE76_014620 [Lolium multiflorum]|uniref:Uncharacterized protein n=1 Tax=Lolium multiflorum TaxID=4521 RepID=A0AAD8X5N0_LOLMU|nr:hypothetical protein QYE76_014620 [Lolium multiflorum]
MAIEQGRLIFNQYAMKVDTHPFPAVNMVECTYPEGCQPGFSFDINVVGPGHHSGKDGDEGSCSRSKDTEEAAPRDRLRHDGKRYITEGEVKNEDISDLSLITSSTRRKTIPTTFFIVDSKSSYAVLLGRDWIHANCCIPSTMHQCVIQWDGDEVEVVQADDSAKISTAGMNAWETAGQEPLSGINLDDCERIDVTKNGVRLVLSTGLTV